MFLKFCTILILFSLTTSCTNSKKIFLPEEQPLAFKNTEHSSCFEKVTLTTIENSKSESYQCKNEYVKIQELPDLDKDIDRRILLLKTMFESQTVPYQGTITKNSTCLSQNSTTPAISENDFEKKYVFNLMATANFIFGSCIEEKDIYKTEYTLLLCKKQHKAYEIKHFYPKLNSFDSLNIHCKE